MKLGWILAAALAISAGANEGAGIEVGVYKRVALSGESPTFGRALYLPCKDKCSRPLIPGDIDSSIDYLLHGMDKNILQLSIEALKSA